MRLHFGSFVSVFGVVFFGAAGTAFAQDDKPAAAAAPSTTPAPAAAPAAAKEKDKSQNGDEEEELKHVTITANPLSLILTRIGLNVEYLPIKHHAIVLNPYFQTLSTGDDTIGKTSYTNFGAELGYHLYTGDRGANGFFVGPSLLYTRANAKASLPNGGPSSSSSSDIYGVALDIGGQHVTKGGFTIGGGAGVMYLTSSTSSSSSATSSTFKFSGVLPRILLTVGYSF